MVNLSFAGTNISFAISFAGTNIISFAGTNIIIPPRIHAGPHPSGENSKQRPLDASTLLAKSHTDLRHAHLIRRESIHHDAGATSPQELPVAQICRVIEEAGRRPVERERAIAGSSAMRTTPPVSPAV